MKRSRNIQVIDDSGNCTYSLFATSEKSFALIFPDGQDIEFPEDVWKRLGKKRARKIFADLWEHPVEKTRARGIHGTLFYGLDEKREFYPSKREYEMPGLPWNAAQRRMIARSRKAPVGWSIGWGLRKRR